MIAAFARLLEKLQSKRAVQNQRTHEQDFFPLYVTPLEERVLLSGNVIATLVGTDLFLHGDELDNEIEITTESNEVVVKGINQTTVNGNDSLVVFDADTTPGSFYVNLKNGENDLFIHQVDVDGNVFVWGGDQNDRVRIASADFGGSLHVNTFGGNDSIGLNQVSTGWSSFLNTWGDEGLISVRDFQVGLDFFAFSGNSDDVLVVENSNVRNNVFVFQHGGNDDNVWSETSVGREFFVWGGFGDDVVTLTETSIGGLSFFFMDPGSDNVAIQEGNSFGRKLFAFGGGGPNESFSADASSVFHRGQRLYNFDTNDANVPLLNARINDPDTGALAASNALQSELGVPVEEQILNFDFSINNPVQSSDTLLVNNPNFRVQGNTLANSQVEIDADGDGIFESRQQAGADGSFAVDVELTHNDSNFGANQIAVRSTSPDGAVLDETVNVHFAVDDVVRVQTTLGLIDIELLSDDAPLTTSNFKNYFDRYTNSIIHRSARYTDGDDFVIQGGGFTFDTGQVDAITTDPPIPNEFNAENSNLRGTVAVALPANNSNGGTSQWFINLNDRNSALDANPFAVFARVIGSGLDVADAIHALNTFNLVNDFGQSALTDVPLIDFNGQQVADESNFVFVNAVNVLLPRNSIPIELTVNIEQNDLINSNGIQIVKNPAFVIQGTTTPGAVVEVARDSDFVFNDGTTIADQNGDFELTVTLLNNETNLGVNNLEVRATDSTGARESEAIDIHFAVGTLVEYQTTIGNFHVELLDDDAPLAVQNFLNYQQRFQDSIFHRSPDIQFVQGGAFTIDNGTLTPITEDAPITNEFDLATNSNVRGTLAVALLPGDPDSGTSQWFINTGDNTSFDANKNTVFGRVLGDGMDVVDAIDALPDFDQRALLGDVSLGFVPLINYVPFSQQLTGTVSVASGSTTLTGVGTAFTTELPADRKILVNGVEFDVAVIVSDTELTLTSAATNDLVGEEAFVNVPAGEGNFARIELVI